MKHSYALSLSTCLLMLLSSPVFADGHHGKKHKKGKVGAMFDRTDVNQDGQLELSEFLAHAEQRFKAMDLNQDGKVTKEEGREAHKKMRKQRREKRKEQHKKHHDDDKSEKVQAD